MPEKIVDALNNLDGNSYKRLFALLNKPSAGGIAERYYQSENELNGVASIVRLAEQTRLAQIARQAFDQPGQTIFYLT